MYTHINKMKQEALRELVVATWGIILGAAIILIALILLIGAPEPMMNLGCIAFVAGLMVIFAYRVNEKNDALNQINGKMSPAWLTFTNAMREHFSRR